VTTTWSDLGCQALAGRTGELRVNVTAGDTGLPLPLVSVDPAPTQGQSNPAAKLTDATGTAVFSGVATGAYTVTASLLGYVMGSADACAPPDDSSDLSIALDPVGAFSSTLNVTIRATGATRKIRVRAGLTYSAEADMSKNTIKTFTLAPAAGNYDIKVYCVDSTGKENLKKTWSAQSLGAGQTVNLPGPTTATYQDIKC
jgi:hypothetical protein